MKAQRVVEVYSYTFSLSSALYDGMWLTPRPHGFTARNELKPIVQEAGRAPGQVLTAMENLTPTEVRFPDRPVRNESNRSVRTKRYNLVNTVCQVLSY
jgi:hypothetical protein